MADDFFALEPWKLFDEVDVFGVKSPDSDKEYFISIMGAEDISYSLAAYEGREALYKFWNLHMLGDKSNPSYLMSIPHLMITLEDLDFMNDDQVRKLKKLGVKSRKDKLPNLVKMTPGLFPHDLNSEELKDMLHILNQSIHVVKEAAEQNKANIHGDQDHDEDYLFRLVKDEKSKTNWVSERIRVPPPFIEIEFTYDHDILTAFKKAPKYNGEIELELQILTTPIQDNEETAYFPALLLAVDSKEQDVLFMDTLQPFPDYKQMLSTIPDVFMQKSLELEMKFTKIKFRNPDLEPALSFLSQQTGLEYIMDDELDGIDIVTYFLYQNLHGEEDM